MNLYSFRTPKLSPADLEEIRRMAARLSGKTIDEEGFSIRDFEKFYNAEENQNYFSQESE